jgi:hypothetical protein
MLQHAAADRRTFSVRVKLLSEEIRMAKHAERWERFHKCERVRLYAEIAKQVEPDARGEIVIDGDPPDPRLRKLLDVYKQVTVEVVSSGRALMDHVARATLLVDALCPALSTAGFATDKLRTMMHLLDEGISNHDTDAVFDAAFAMWPPVHGAIQAFIDGPTEPECRLRIDGERLLLDGSLVEIDCTSERRSGVLAILADLIAHRGCWRSGLTMQEAADVPLDGSHIRRYLTSLPKVVCDLIESKDGTGYLLARAAWRE